MLRGVGGFLVRNWLWLLLVSLPINLASLFATGLVFSAGIANHLINDSPASILPTRNLIRIVVNIIPVSIIFALIVARVTAGAETSTRLAGLHRAPMVILANIMSTIAVAIGVLLLIVPGVLIAMAWFVATPVIVAEGVPAPSCFTRSGDLTRGHRWPIFGLQLIFTIGSTVFGIGVGLLVVLAERAVGAGVPRQALQWITFGGTGFAGAIGACVNAVGVAVTYRELIRIRGGLGAKEVATIFD